MGGGQGGLSIIGLAFAWFGIMALVEAGGRVVGKAQLSNSETVVAKVRRGRASRS